MGQGLYMNDSCTPVIHLRGPGDGHSLLQTMTEKSRKRGEERRSQLGKDIDACRQAMEVRIRLQLFGCM